MQVLKLSVYLCKLICNCAVFVGGIAYSSARFGAGTGPIFLDDVQCTSSSSQLLECSSRPILTHNCQRSDDAGVGCEGMLIMYNIAHLYSILISVLTGVHGSGK